MTNNVSDRHAALVAAIDAHGADLSRWRDRGLANRVREAVLADRDLRAHLDRAAALGRRLDAARQAIDRDIAASGAIERVSAAAMARRSPRARARWMAAAAAVVLAAGIGGIVDARLMAGTSRQSMDVVVLDPLVFGPLETDIE